MPRLSLLPPELLANILQSLSFSKDLYAIIKTSSQFYRIFKTYKQSILSAILLRVISQKIEADFILAHHAQRIWKLISKHVSEETPGAQLRRIREGEFFDSLYQDSTAILDRFEKKDERLSELISDRTLLLDLWEFYCNVEHLMILYSIRAMPNLHQSFSDSNQPLSFNEQARLQRAFFRCEIYTCLIQLSQLFDNYTRFSMPLTDPAPRFRAMLQVRPWEVEEISCVAQFYQSLVEELSDRIEEDFVTVAKQKMHMRVMSSEKANDESRKSLRHALHYHALWWYDDSHKGAHRPRHIHYLVSRGILYMRKLVSAPFPIVRRMVVDSDLEARSNILMLPGLKLYTDGKGESVEGHPMKDDESLEHCNFGWLWAVEQVKIMNAPANYELRNEGYVFWDKARLQKFEKFQAPRASVEKWYEFPFGHQEHSNRPGVTTKLKDESIHPDVVDEVCHEILEAGGNDDDRIVGCCSLFYNRG